MSSMVDLAWTEAFSLPGISTPACPLGSQEKRGLFPRPRVPQTRPPHSHPREDYCNRPDFDFGATREFLLDPGQIELHQNEILVQLEAPELHQNGFRPYANCRTRGRLSTDSSINPSHLTMAFKENWCNRVYVLGGARPRGSKTDRREVDDSIVDMPSRMGSAL